MARTIVLFVALVPSCGGSGVEIDELAHELAVVMCERIEECCTSEEIERFVPIAGDCVESFTAFFEEEADVVDMRASVAAGRVVYDADQATLCIDHARTQSCAAFSAFVDEAQAATGLACLRMLRGTVALGGACTEHYDCVSGHCAYLGDAQMCVEPYAAGETCNPHCEDRFECARCEGELLCDQASETCVAEPAIVPLDRCNGV